MRGISLVATPIILTALAGLAGCGSHSAAPPVASSTTSSTTPVVVPVVVPVPAHSPTWTWESGSTAANTAGTYTAQGTPSATGPGGRYADIQWRDTSGNLWVFGGTGVIGNGTIGLLSDLWKYNLATNQWTWANGPDTVNGAGSYGTLGVAAASNLPPARTNSVGWTDSYGNLWLFGGESAGPTYRNDLWEYTPSTNEWTWQGGPDTTDTAGVYGTEGVASTSNIPGPRVLAPAVTDNSSGAVWVWIFGGYSYGGTLSGDMNDLWRYDPAAKAWAWEAGADTTNQAGVYGTLGTPAPGNTPGARQGAMMWVDAAGNLWLFGGYGYDSTGTQGALNDLWKFTPSSREWTWEGGSNLQNPSAIYGTLGTAAAGNIPAGTFSGASWTGSSGNFWSFGGAGEYNNELNDLWMYDPTTSEWTWEGGSQTNTAGIYGTEGVASTSNLPGARLETNASVDSTGNVWLFGGYGYDANNNLGDLNDLWKLVP